MIANEVPSSKVVGLDIGVGSSCIYPALAVKHFGWQMIGTEMDQQAFDEAMENLERNRSILEDNIKLMKTEGEEDFFSAAVTKETDALSFCMCNPPFHEDGGHAEEGEDVCNAMVSGEDDVDSIEEAQKDPAGKNHELKTSGGEVQFIQKMFADSQKHTSEIKIFTCMVGHKASVKQVRKLLHENQEQYPELQFCQTEFCQGKTVRWGIAWTFADAVLVDSSVLKKKQEERRKHAPVSFQIEELLPGQKITNCKVLFHQVHSWLDTIEVQVKPGKLDDDRCTFTMKSFHQNWKNQRRKRRAEKRAAEKDMDIDDEPVETKRVKTGEVSPDEEMEVDKVGKSKKGDLQICCKVMVELKEGKACFDVIFIDGIAGKDGLHQVLQFIKNKTKGF